MARRPARTWIPVNAVQQSVLNKKDKNMTTIRLRKSIGRSPSRLVLLFIALTSACFALSPTAQAQLSPPPDGGYPGDNTAEGEDALFSLPTGTDNTALGFEALFSLTTGDSNTATGSQTLLSNTTGIRNTAVGFAALANNTTGDRNTATGRAALPNNTTGARNTGDGQDALFNNTTGNDNAATGHFALFSNTTGNNNVALGNFAGQNLTTGDNNIDIGNQGIAGEANTIRIGTMGTQTAIYVAGIMGKTVPMSTPVFVNSKGQLGTTTSSARFKEAIKPMDNASEAILALKPVTFRYKKELDPMGVPQFGLVAEQVEKVNPDLVVRDQDGKVYSVRYEAVNAMLLNEFLKEHRKMEELKSIVAKQEATAAQQQTEIKTLTASLKEQASQIQKVSAQVELNKPAAQMAVNNR
jgi:hypothetical protein